MNISTILRTLSKNVVVKHYELFSRLKLSDADKQILHDFEYLKADRVELRNALKTISVV